MAGLYAGNTCFESIRASRFRFFYFFAFRYFQKNLPIMMSKIERVDQYLSPIFHMMLFSALTYKQDESDNDTDDENGQPLDRDTECPELQGEEKRVEEEAEEEVEEEVEEVEEDQEVEKDLDGNSADSTADQASDTTTYALRCAII